MTDVEAAYLETVERHGVPIVGAYLSHKGMNPVVLLDLTGRRIYAYPYEEFMKILSERGQTMLAQQYNRALREDEFIVFVRDCKNKRLLSYSLEQPVLEWRYELEQVEKPPPNMDVWPKHDHRIGGARKRQRIRGPGGGRKLAEVKDPAIVPTLERLLNDQNEIGGDPMTEQKWVRSSLRRLSEQLAAAGHPASAPTVGRLLKKGALSSLQVLRRAILG